MPLITFNLAAKYLSEKCGIHVIVAVVPRGQSSERDKGAFKER